MFKIKFVTAFPVEKERNKKKRKLRICKKKIKHVTVQEILKQTLMEKVVKFKYILQVSL